MRSLILILLLGIINWPSILSQDHILDWAIGIGGNGFDNGLCIVTDKYGNIYTAGTFKGTVDFDPGNGVEELTAVGTNTWDAFIQKLSPDGDLIWVKHITGGYYETIFSITLDDNGNLYATGNFSNTINFNNGNPSLTSNGYTDIFVLKLDIDGNFQWAKQVGGQYIQAGKAITTDNTGNVYITGYFAGTVDFDPSLGTSTLACDGASQNAFVLKLDASGNFMWAIQPPGSFYDNQEGASITTDIDDNIYITGYLEFVNSRDYFVQKLDPSGNEIWLKNIANYSENEGNSLAVDALGNVYVSGYFESDTDFQFGAGITYLNNFGSADIFVQKLDQNGNLIWVKQIGGTNHENSTSLIIDASNYLYISGNFSGTVDFDPSDEVYELTSNGEKDFFIEKMDIDGNFIWVKQMGGSDDDFCYAIACDSSSNLYATGYFKLTVDFDPNEDMTNLMSHGSADAFIQKLTPCESTGLIEESTCKNYTSPSGNYIWETSGTYFDTVPNYRGCDSIITCIITINAPDVSVTSDSITITANANNAIYQWLNCSNNYTPISGANSQSYSDPSGGHYAVQITKNECIDTSACINIIATNVKNITLNNNIVLYPNPIKDLLRIEISNLFSSGIEASLKDLQGKNLQVPIQRFGNKITLDVSSLAKGSYIVTISSQGQNENHLILKE